MGFGRRRGDSPPDSQRAVLLVPLGSRVSTDAVRRAIDCAAGGPIAVLGLLKIHGYSLGMPNPGLMPTKKERDQQVALVAEAIDRLEKLGGEADGQVASTRHPVRAVTAVVTRRGVHHVVIDQPTLSRVRRSLEGDVAAGVRRRVGTKAEVVITEAPAPPASAKGPSAKGPAGKAPRSSTR